MFNLVSFSQTDSLPESCSSSCLCSIDPTPAGVMISHVHQKNEWMISYRLMNMDMNGVLNGSKSIPSNDVFANYLMSPSKMRMDMHMLMGMVGITDRLTSMVMFNYGVNSMEMTPFTIEGHIHPGMEGMNTKTGAHSMKTAGFGDVKVQLLYGLIQRSNQQLLISGGLSLPVGSIQKKGSSVDMMYPNSRFPYSMQLGSGTVDFLPCINYLYQISDFTFNAQVSSVVRLGYNRVGYKLGNELTINPWIAYNWIDNLTSSVRFETTIWNKINGIDPTVYSYNEPSANSLNYGGKRANLFLGSTYQFQNGFFAKNRFGIEYGIPVYQNLNGIQMNLKHSIYLSWSITF